MHPLSSPPVQALVIPAFESQQYKMNYPTSKEALLRKLQQHTLLPFRQHEWPQGHQPTDYEQWYHSSKPYQVQSATPLQCMYVFFSLHMIDILFYLMYYIMRIYITSDIQVKLSITEEIHVIP